MLKIKGNFFTYFPFHSHSTFETFNKQANIKAKKQEQFHKKLQEKPEQSEPISTTSSYFDSRVKLPEGNSRPRRSFKFYEPGKFERMGKKLRTKVCFLILKFFMLCQLMASGNKVSLVFKQLKWNWAVQKFLNISPKNYKLWLKFIFYPGSIFF